MRNAIKILNISTPFEKVTQHQFYHYINLCMDCIHYDRYHLKAWVFVFPLIHVSFVMITLLERAQGD